MAEDGDALLHYLGEAMRDLDLSPPEQLLFDAHIIGALSWHVDENDWRSVVDRAVLWCHERRAKPL